MRTKKELLDIFLFIIYKKQTNFKEIEITLRYSQRKIRYEIENINFFLKAQLCTVLIKNERGNIKFDSDKFDKKYLEPLFFLEKVSKEERIEFISLKLILEDKINLKELEKEFKISRTSIKADFQEVENLLKKNDIKIIYKGRYFISGLEYQKRLILVNLLISKLEKLTHPINGFTNSQNMLVKYILKYITPEEIGALKTFIKTLFKGEIKNSRSYKPLLAYLIVCLIRIKNNFSLLENPIKGFIFTTLEYEEIDKNIEVLERELKIKIQKLEKIYIAEFLLNLSYNSFENYFYKDSIILNSFVCKILKDLETIYDTKFSRDSLLKEGLLNHIKPAIYRMKNNIQIEKIEISDKERVEIFDDLFNQIKKIIKPIENEYRIRFTNDEILLLSIHIQDSLERNKDEENKIENILLFCSGGYATSTILKYKLEELYDLKKIDIITPLDYDEIPNKKIDLIVTTIELESNKYLKDIAPIVKVNSYLGKEDLKELDLYKLKRKKIKSSPEEILKLVKIHNENNKNNELIKELENLFYGDNCKSKKIFLEYLEYNHIFYEEKKLEDWKKSIQLGVNYMCKNNFVEKIYGDKIIDLIDEYGPYMIIREGVIIPHSRIDNSVNKTGMFLLKLKNPVMFPGNKMIDTLIFISAKEKNDHVKGLEDLLFLLDEKDLKKKIDIAKNQDELIKIFKEINEKEYKA